MLDKYFHENEDLNYLERLMNKKSNLLLNLNKFEGNQKIKYIIEIANLELDIINELKNNKIREGTKKKLIYNSLISSINVLIGEFPKKAYKIALKGFSDDYFDESSKKTFFQLIKEIRRNRKDIFIENNFQFFNYIIKKHIDESIAINKQNLNKFELYVFDKLNYSEVLSANLELHPRTISNYPLYSPELSKYLNKIIKMKILKQKDRYLLPNIHYKVSEKQALFFENKINRELIKKIDKIIFKFSTYDTKKIEIWEKGLKFLEYFETQETF